MSYAVFSPSPVSDFTVILMYSAPLTYSQLNSAHVLTFHLFKLRLSFYLSFYLFSVLPVNSVPLSFNHLLFYSLIILCTLCTFSSFFVFACEYLLHVILSVPCYILPFPSLTVSHDISYV